MRSLVLAGGRSRRMGRDKALIEIEGHSCISRDVSALREAGLEPIRIAVARPENIDDYGATIPTEIDVEWVLDGGDLLLVKAEGSFEFVPFKLHV